jgi:hypothetical protein
VWIEVQVGKKVHAVSFPAGRSACGLWLFVVGDYRPAGFVNCQKCLKFVARWSGSDDSLRAVRTDSSGKN